MPNSVELRQQRARVVESMRAITEAAEQQNRNLNGEERVQFDRHSEDFRSLGERIERAEALEQAEAEDAVSLSERGGDRPDGQDRRSKEERAAQRRAAFMQFVRRGVGGLAPEQRALVEDTAGEILVPEDLEAEIYRAIPGLTVMRDLCGQRSTDRNRIRRRSLDEVSMGWGKLETGGTVADSMPDTPEEEWTYIEDLVGLALVGVDEFEDTDVDLESFISDSFARARGEAEDTGFAVGTGHADEMPLGIFAPTGTGISTVAAAANNALSVDDFLKLIYAVPGQYRKNGSFLVPSSTELHISTKKDSNGQYLWQPSVQAGRPNTFKGYEMHNQEDIAAIAAAKKVASFGDYKAGYRIYDRRGLRVQRLVEKYATEGKVGFLVTSRVTGDVVRSDAIRILQTPA